VINMNAQRYADIGEAWKNAGRPNDEDKVVEALLLAGITDSAEDRATVREFLKDYSLDTGILYATVKTYNERLQARRQQQQAEKVRGLIEQMHAITAEAIEKPAIDIAALKTPVEDLADLAGDIKAAYTPPKEPLSPDGLLDFGDTRSIAVDFLGGLRLPSPGITFIGGKTGGGKTTALINAVRSFLKDGLSVSMFSYEQSAPDLALLLALSITADSLTIPVDPVPDYGNPRRWHGSIIDPTCLSRRNEILSDYPTTLKAYIRDHGLPPFLEPAYKTIREAIEDGRLELWDYFGHAGELADRIRKTDMDVYVVDYIQVIPPPPGGRKDGYQRIADVAAEFRELSSAHGKTVIIGAQFNRQTGETVDPNEYDPSVEQFREAGDIEHLAALALGLGWFKTTDGDKAHYWKVLKHRYNGAARDARMFSGGEFKYYYLQPYSRWYPAKQWPPSGPGIPEKAKPKKRKPEGSTGTTVKWESADQKRPPFGGEK